MGYIRYLTHLLGIDQETFLRESATYIKGRSSAFFELSPQNSLLCMYCGIIFENWECVVLNAESYYRLDIHYHYMIQDVRLSVNDGCPLCEKFIINYDLQHGPEKDDKEIIWGSGFLELRAMEGQADLFLLSMPDWSWSLLLWPIAGSTLQISQEMDMQTSTTVQLGCLSNSTNLVRE